MPKHRAVKFLVGERNNINIGRLVNYAAAIAEDENTTSPTVKIRNGETRTKHRRVEQLYGRHLVFSGAVMAKSKKTTTFDQNHKLFNTTQKHHANVKCLENLRSCINPKSLSHFQNSGFTKIKQTQLNFDQPPIM